MSVILDKYTVETSNGYNIDSKTSNNTDTKQEHKPITFATKQKQKRRQKNSLITFKEFNNMSDQLKNHYVKNKPHLLDVETIEHIKANNDKNNLQHKNDEINTNIILGLSELLTKANDRLDASINNIITEDRIREIIRQELKKIFK